MFLTTQLYQTRRFHAILLPVFIEFSRCIAFIQVRSLSDIINLILFCSQAKVEIPYHQEKNIILKLYEMDNPILWASYLLYAQYSKRYFQEIRDVIGKLILDRIDAIVKKIAYIHLENFGGF